MGLFESVDSRKKLRSQLIFFLCWLGITGFGVYLKASPNGHGTHLQLGLPPCGSVVLFNRPCPGCGLTTSFTAFLHGQWLTSLQAHPLGPLFYLGITLFAWTAFYGWITKRRFLMSAPLPHRTLMVFAVVFLSFGLVRFLLMPNYGKKEDWQIVRRMLRLPELP